MKSYDLLVFVVFIPEGRPQQRILLLGGRLTKLPGNLVRVFASLDGGRRFFRQFGSRQNRPLAGGIVAASTAGGSAGGRVTAGIRATAEDGPVPARRAGTAEALIRCRAYTASGDGLLFGAHDFVEVFKGFVEDTFRLGYAARRTGAAGTAAGPVALLASGAPGIAAKSAIAGFRTAGLAGVAALAAALLAPGATFASFLAAGTFASGATFSGFLATRLAGVATLTATVFAAVTTLHAVLASAFLALTARSAVAGLLTTGLTRVTALAVAAPILTLRIALLTARLTGRAVTLTAGLLPLLARQAAGGRGKTTAR